MSFEKTTCSVIRCDGPCKALLEWDYIVHFSDLHGGLSDADDYLSELEWLTTDDGKHFCPNCTTYDEAKEKYVGLVAS